MDKPTALKNSATAVSTEIHEFSANTLAAQDRQAKLLQQVEAQRRARTISVPTLDADVRTKLRSIGKPVTLFGEKPENRRDRLRKILAEIEVGLEEEAAVTDIAGFGDAQADPAADSSLNSDGSAKQTEKFYTPANDDLIGYREVLAKRTFLQAAKRVRTEKEQKRKRRNSQDTSAYAQEEKHAADLYKTVKELHCVGSQIGDKRAISSVTYSPCQQFLLTSSWSGQSNVWKKDTMENVRTYAGHTDRVLEADWHPKAGLDGGPTSTSASFATASADGTAMLWSLEQGTKPLRTLEGHTARLAHVAWHPHGDLVGTTAYDRTWRLWDAERGKEVLCQEGHAVDVYSLGFQCDGSLVATGDLGGVARVWDLRSGKSIFLMQGHAKGAVFLDWAPCGYKLATAGDDHTVRLWDLRAKRCEYVLPAHNHLVSKVKFAPVSGEYFVTSSFDRTCRIWSTRDYSNLATLAAHDDKLIGFDIAQDEKHFVTCSFDRTFKSWSHVSEF